MGKNNGSRWRKAFSYEYERCDYDCEEVWVSQNGNKMVKFPSSSITKQNGKYGLFSLSGEFLGRKESVTPPFQWADETIDGGAL